MGFFDRFRRRPTPSPEVDAPGTATEAAPAAAPLPNWELTTPRIAAMKVSTIIAGTADDPQVLGVHAAIETALGDVFGDQVPLAWSREPPGALALIRAYWVDRRAGAYFHYLGWGLSVSGFPVELTLKVQAFDDERVRGEPIRARLAPTWPVELLSRLATAIQRSGRPFGHDHWIAAGAASFGPEAIRHLACAFDPSFGPIATPNGAFRYLQIYPIDDTELEAFKQADRERRDAPVLAARLAADPELVISRHHRA